MEEWLVQPDEVRRFDKTIALIRSEPPYALDPVGYHEIGPMRGRAGINPLHGKKFRGRIKLRL